MRLRTGSPRLKAFVRAAVIRASTTAVVLGVAVSASLIRVKAVVGRFFFRLAFTDRLGVGSGDYFAEDYTDPGYTVTSFSATMTKPRSDTVAAGDVGTLLRPTKGLSETVDLADVVALAGIMGIIDAAEAADSGTLRMQDYCDFDYFAEDYVGESRTF